MSACGGCVVVMVVQGRARTLSTHQRRSSLELETSMAKGLGFRFCFVLLSSIFFLCFICADGRPSTTCTAGRRTETHTHYFIHTKASFHHRPPHPPFIYSSSIFFGRERAQRVSTIPCSFYFPSQLRLSALSTYVRPPQNSGHSHLSTWSPTHIFLIQISRPHSPLLHRQPNSKFFF